jgi:Flp pilus assembly pilin Flp
MFNGLNRLCRVAGQKLLSGKEITSFLCTQASAHRIAPELGCPRGSNPDKVGGHNMMTSFLCRLWREAEGQDIAEYAVMLAVILVIVVGTVRLIGSNANNVFSSVASSISQ